MDIYIYALIDPRDKCVRYVGRTQNPKNREIQHRSLVANCSGKPRKRWLVDLRSEGLVPQFVILETCHDNNWPAREKFWIRHYRTRGELFNVHEGGAYRAYQATRKGFFHKQKTKELLRDKTKKQFSDPSCRERHRQAMEKWRNGLSEEDKLKFAESGRRSLVKARAADSFTEAGKTFWISRWASMAPDERAEFIAKRTEKMRTPEYRERISKITKARNVSDSLRDIWRRRKAGLLPQRKPRADAGVSRPQIAVKAKESWKDPLVRQRRIEGLNKSWALRKAIQ